MACLVSDCSVGHDASVKKAARMSIRYTFRVGAPRKQRLREPLSYKKRRNLEEDRVRLMSLRRILKLKKSLSRTLEVRANTGRRMHIFLEWFFAKYGLFFNVNIVLVHPAPLSGSPTLISMQCKIRNHTVELGSKRSLFRSCIKTLL